MKLYLVQHGKAKSKEEDLSRPLSQEGVNESEKMADFLTQISIKVPRIYHSSKLRARQTAGIFAGHLKPRDGLEEREGLAPNDDPLIWKECLRAENKYLMLIGHLPHLSRLASLLLCGNSDEEIVGFSNSAIVCLEKTGDNWLVRWMLTAQLLV